MASTLQVVLDAARCPSTVVAERPTLVPDPSEVEKRISREHPRILFRPGDFDRLRALLSEPPFRDCFEALVKLVEPHLGQSLPQIVLPPDFYQPELPAWDRRYPRSAEGMKANGPISQAVKRSSQLIPASALLYRLTGDRRYRDLAVQGLGILSTLDLTATSYHNTHGFHAVISPLSVGLDYLWDELEPDLLKQSVAALAARAREFHPLSLQRALQDPLDSHSISYGPPAMSYAALALYHQEPEAVQWMTDLLTYLDRFPGPGGYGGDDGGWAQGFGYGDHWALQRLLHMVYVATEISFYEIPWVRNNGRAILYFQPPYGNCPNFGDASYNRPKSLQRQVMLTWAAVHRNPCYQWFAEQIDEPLWGAHDFMLSHFLYWSQTPQARAPSDLPLAIHLRDTDWVAMHSHLADRERNVMLQFKSSPFGSASHSHADQNSFVLEALGRPLLIDSGYYPWYGSPHDVNWTRQTLAHNALLINGRGQGIGNRAAAGQIIAFTTSEDFDYTAGDATAAYQQPSRPDAPGDLCAANEGVARMVRHIIFARPDVFVILDDVKTEEPAELQFLLHAPHPFEIDAERQTVTTRNLPAVAHIHLLGPGSVAFRQTDQFSVPPDIVSEAARDSFPSQWHLTCSFAPTTAARRLLTVIVAGRDSLAPGASEVERLEGPEMLGARVGKTEVEFHAQGDSVIVKCCGRRVDGTAVAYTIAGPTRSGTALCTPGE